MSENVNGVLEAVKPLLPGAVAAQWFRPKGEWEKATGFLVRGIRALRGGGSGYDDPRLSQFSVLAATPERVVLYRAKMTRKGIDIGEPAGDWPIGGVALQTKRMKVEFRGSSNPQGVGSMTSKIVRATLTPPAGEPAVEMDFPDAWPTSDLIKVIRGEAA